MEHNYLAPHAYDWQLIFLIWLFPVTFLTLQLSWLHMRAREKAKCFSFSRVDRMPRSLVIFQILLEGERIKGITRGPFETFQLGMKSRHVSTLISKRSSSSPAVSHPSTLGVSSPAMWTLVHLTTIWFAHWTDLITVKLCAVTNYCPLFLISHALKHVCIYPASM